MNFCEQMHVMLWLLEICMPACTRWWQEYAEQWR